MRLADNFNPQWGYLAPAPSFLRTARIVLAAVAIGATSGAAVVYALVEPPATENESVAARTLVHSSDSALAPGTAFSAPALLPAQPHVAAVPTGAPPVQGRGSNLASTVQGPASMAALAEAPAATASPPPTGQTATASGAPASASASAAPVQRKVVNKPRAVWPSLARQQAFAWPYGTSRAPVGPVPSGGFWQRADY
jgi:hypothetical protein